MKIPRHIRQIVAAHEAGHAVVMVAQKSEIEYVTIKPGGGMLGHVKPSVSPDGDPLVSTCAGMMGVELYRPGGERILNAWIAKQPSQPSSDPVMNDGELAYAFAVASRPIIDTRDIPALDDRRIRNRYTCAYVNAAAILERHWPAFLRVIHELLRDETVSGGRVHAIVRGSPRIAAPCVREISTDFFQPLPAVGGGAM